MTIDETLLREELGGRPFPATFRPPAEIEARARELRRRRGLLRTGAALAVAAAVATTLVALRPGESGPALQPARGTAPIDIPCPGPGGAPLPLVGNQDLVMLPPGAAVRSVVVRQAAVDCRLLHAETTGTGGPGQGVTGRWLAVAPDAVPAYRTAPVPGRHETRTIAGLPVDVWWVDEPVPQYRAYWKAPDGVEFGVHAENMDGDLRRLAEQVETSKIPVRFPAENYRPDPERLQYLTAALDVPGTGPVELTVTRLFFPVLPPAGARVVAVPGHQTGWWWEEDGVGHLSWVQFTYDGSTRARVLSGAGLTAESAAGIASSLQRVRYDDPRIP
jgi:hypothetical protein